MADGDRNFFSKKDGEVSARYSKRKSKNKRKTVHVAMHSNVFNQLKSENMMATNSMFASMVDEIVPCIEPISTKDKVIVDLYEAEEPDDLEKNLVFVGFKKYVNGCLASLSHQRNVRLSIFSSFLVIGILIEFLLYGILTQDFNPFWLFKSIEVLGTLFIWQFGGYIVYEYLGESKKIRRYKQLSNIKFNIKHWE